MKMFSNIIIAFTTLILLVFGAGGVGVSKCACSGRTSLVIPLEQSCCPIESDCMTVTVVHFSASVFQQSVDVPLPQPIQLAAVSMVQQPVCCFMSVIVPIITSGHPPTDFVETTVLRV